MRHKYDTQGIVLSRAPSGEANAFVTILTSDLGLVFARVQGVRHSGAKLSAALTTLAQSSITLVRGKEGWRVTGAVLEERWFEKMQTFSVRRRAARISGLLVRMVVGEHRDADLFVIATYFFKALTVLPEEMHESAEILAALRVLSALGLDAGTIPGAQGVFDSQTLSYIASDRPAYIARINRGIEASGL